MRGVLFFNFIAGLFWIVHLVACGWYLCAALHDDPSKTWLGRRNVPFDAETTLLDAPPFDQWLHGMYFALTVFTTVGFGDITAITNYEILYVCATMIVGAIVHSILVGEMIKVVTRVDQETIERSHQRQLVDGFARHTELDAQASNKNSSMGQEQQTSTRLRPRANAEFDHQRSPPSRTLGAVTSIAVWWGANQK
jgi:hypothetical protein